jgi:hypothetical protein
VSVWHVIVITLAVEVLLVATLVAVYFWQQGGAS